MFKLYIPITKSAQKNSNTFIIEGIASSPIIDKHQEKFSPDAIKKMQVCITKKELPIRVEHYDLLFTNIGVWKEATILEGDKLYVKGEINTDLSIGKDIKVLLESGVPVCLSVGGQVIDASFEYSKELERHIRVFKDVELEEISVVKNPANDEARLITMAKSVDWESVEKTGLFSHTSEAKKLIKYYRNMNKTIVPPEEFSRLVSDETEKGKGGKKKPYSKFEEWGDQMFETIKELFTEFGVEKDCDVEEGESRMTAEDLQLLAKLLQIMTEVDLPEDGDFPEILQDDVYWASMTEEMQIVLYNRAMTMPHHNVDLSLNRSLVLYQLKRAIDDQSWYRPKDFTVIINHLYRHLKDLALVKSNSSTPNHNEIMKDKTIKNNAPKTDVVEPTEVKKEDVETTETVETTVEEVETPATTEEAAPEAPADVEPTEEAADVEAADVEAPEKPEATEDVVEEEEGVEKKAIVKVELDSSSLTKSMTELTGMVETLSKKLEKAEAVESRVADLEKALGEAVEVLNVMATVSKGRKSQARHIAIEKAFQNPHGTTIKSEEADKELSFRDHYKNTLEARYKD